MKRKLVFAKYLACPIINAQVGGALSVVLSMMGKGFKMAGVFSTSIGSFRVNGGESIIDFGNDGGEELSELSLVCDCDKLDIMEAVDMSKDSDIS